MMTLYIHLRVVYSLRTGGHVLILPEMARAMLVSVHTLPATVHLWTYVERPAKAAMQRLVFLGSGLNSCST